ncbi:unnamed protein product [Rotaria magnacalcarata]|uniref:Uncharacterized protein n=3 Tax=Rotaria magnacalcarata TaxID=392030 RepID=A0A819TAF7_9BILA|nr:unnamed protein product [Rotaria magnacalcarata]CAF2058181.1 unnamed protein product [Rotaria magnacalcarata]CAF2104268.1 unnamed protein product [Rotaria magnacalcarata]CAF4073757.1 unnamed protein product [Rotaria magnacalcarata]CAF4125101.1 unnamed protein product [Rotaria magnacalcarata]
MDYSRRYGSTYFILLILPYIFIVYSYISKRSSTTSSGTIPIKQKLRSTQSTNTGRVLVIYVWADTDVQSLGNLQFFIRYGVHPSQPADYYFILQQVGKKPVNQSRLPSLPPNAHYIQHENECFDFGTFGWFLSRNIVNTSLYKYFIFMNASIRGPYFTAYFDDEHMWWFTVFTKRLNDEIKLVGSTINCEYKPHVQSYLLVTDRIGLSILTDQKQAVFSCKKGYSDAVFNGEIGASQLIIHANYQIASLQIKYQGWDFRKKENEACNNRVSPIFLDRSVDGIGHDPYELVFVKYKGLPPFDTDLERRALIYQKWLEEQPSESKKLKFK